MGDIHCGVPRWTSPSARCGSKLRLPPYTLSRDTTDHVVLAEYHCRYDWREHKVTDIRDGVFYATRFASTQGSLVPLTPQES